MVAPDQSDEIMAMDNAIRIEPLTMINIKLSLESAKLKMAPWQATLFRKSLYSFFLQPVGSEYSGELS